MSANYDQELIDQLDKLHNDDQRLRFTAQKPTILRGERYRRGDTILVRFKTDKEDFLRDRIGEGGAWGWGGYTSRAISAAAESIESA